MIGEVGKIMRKSKPLVNYDFKSDVLYIVSKKGKEEEQEFNR
jgi:hypothetical protein